MFKEMLQPDLVKLNCDEGNQLDLFQSVGKELREKDYVTEDYIDALLKREEQFPTGLKTQFLNIALPHTDPHVIKKPFIFVIKNKQPIDMLQMGDNSETPCQYFLFLGIKNPKEQVGLLSKLMALFMQEEFVHKFIQSDNESDIYQLFVNNF